MSIATTAFNKELLADIDVTGVFSSLMKAATGQDSVYIKTKETLNQLLADNLFSEKERGTIITNTLVGMSTAITNSTLDLAFKVAVDSRDAQYSLAKERASTQLINAQREKVVSDDLLVVAQELKIQADIRSTNVGIWKAIADIYTKNGFDLRDKLFSETSFGSTNALVYPLASDTVQAEGTKAATYSKIAGSRMQNGNVNYTVDTKGDIALVTTTSELIDSVAGTQIRVARRTEKGFDDNMRQHAANSTSSMIGMLLSSQSITAINEQDVSLWRNAVTYLSSNNGGAAASITITSTGAVASSDSVISGTSVGGYWGANVKLTAIDSTTLAVITGFVPIGIVAPDGVSWSVVVLAGTLPIGTYSVTARMAGASGVILTNVKDIVVT